MARRSSSAEIGEAFHVAIVMDGNGRWAAARGRARAAGHRRGAHAVRRTVRAAPSLGITTLTLFAFSSDNWKRPQREVETLLNLFGDYLQSEQVELQQNGVRLSVIGRRDRLPGKLTTAIEACEAATAWASRLHLRLAVDYSARDAIRREEWETGESMPVETVINARVPVKVWTDSIEPQAIEQLKNTASLPFVFHHVAAMADVHLGIGATVGSVVATKGAVCPAAVGVDIGCGMMARKTAIPSERLGAATLKKLRQSIEREIPVGFQQKKEPFAEGLAWARDRSRPHVASDSLMNKAVHQLGSLGGGNHFIEVCIDEDDGLIWLLLHSGSRNIGKSVAEIHIDRAKGALREAIDHLPDRNLAYFLEGTPDFIRYREDVHWCQEYAFANREIMMARLLRQVAHALGFEGDVSKLGLTMSVNCHHNYIADEVHFGERVLVTRKGAIRAGAGELGIIPGSMGTGSFIVRGLGNRDSFESAPHGAGRKMSRGEAKRRFSCEDLARQTEGVECRKDAGVLDEIPGAYKPIGEVIEKSSDLVEVVARLRQVVCVKG